MIMANIPGEATKKPNPTNQDWAFSFTVQLIT